MPITLIQANPHGFLRGPCWDECLSSWVSRQGGAVKLVPEQHIRRHECTPHGLECDYGELRIHDPDIDKPLAAQLQRAAWWPAPYVLPPSERDSVCFRCLAEQWVRGQPLYRGRRWSIAWHGSCSKHGPLTRAMHLPEKLNEWPKDTFSSLDLLDHDLMVLQTPVLPVPINLFRDQRGCHLEAALDDLCVSKWHPRFFDQEALHYVYAEITKHLLMQFSGRNGWVIRRSEVPHFRGKVVYPGKGRDQNHAVQYWARPQITVHHLNVLAEAILAVWTATPLPAAAGPTERTKLIVQIIGWDLRPPDRAHNLVHPQGRPGYGSLYACATVPPFCFELSMVDLLIDKFPKQLRDALKLGLRGCRSHPVLGGKHLAAMYTALNRQTQEQQELENRQWLTLCETMSIARKESP